MSYNSDFHKSYSKILKQFNKLEIENKAEEKKLIKILNDNRYIKIKDNVKPKFGERVADGIAKFGGSWAFIDSFLFFLIVWMALNVSHLFGVNFDPYPFILLNLALSCIAAIQAPIIMMSQNRQAKRDKIASDNDARVNAQANAKLNLVMRRLENIHNELEQNRKLEQLLIEIKLNERDDNR